MAALQEFEEINEDPKQEGVKSSDKNKFNFEEFLSTHRYSLTFFLLGLILIGAGILFFKKGVFNNSSKIEIMEDIPIGEEASRELVVEISGAIEKPGVYKLPAGSRVEDLLIAAGGISADADRDWLELMVNRAAKLTDGQKIFIPAINQQSNTSSANNTEGAKVYQAVQGSAATSLVNINTASQKVLEELPGIGPVYAQRIIEHRPYSIVDELVSKDALKSGVYEKIKDSITVY